MAQRPYSSTIGSLAHATVSMVFYGEDLKISNTGSHVMGEGVAHHTDQFINSLINCLFWLKPKPKHFHHVALSLFELVLGFLCPWFFPIWVFHVNPCVSVIYCFIRISLIALKIRGEQKPNRKPKPHQRTAFTETVTQTAKTATATAKTVPQSYGEN
ncbi:hypothetical protein LXL04_021994 [Taraxacum kok-saghyz]